MNAQGWTNRWQDHLHRFQVTDSYAGITRSLCVECSSVSIAPADEPAVQVSQLLDQRIPRPNVLWGGARLAS